MGNLIKRGVPVRKRGDEAGGLYFTSPKSGIEFISSGCVLLDCVLGGGWPLGRIANIVGDKSTGKTLLAIEACANFARRYHNGDILYIEAEAAFDKTYAQALGLPTERITFPEGIDTVEHLFSALSTFLAGRERPGLVIVDSLDALSDTSEMEREIDKGSFGAAKAKMMSQLFRRLVRPLESTKVCVLIISQVRDAIGVMFGDKHTRSGGKALDFYASQALWLSLLKTNKQVVSKIDRAVSLTIRARCKKNKISLPLRECEFNLRFGYGIEDLDAGVDFLTKIGKEKLAPPLDKMKRMRGKELTEARAALNKVVIEQWHIFERNFVSSHRKYTE